MAETALSLAGRYLTKTKSDEKRGCLKKRQPLYFRVFLISWMSLFTGGRTFSTKQIKHSILTKALDADGADLVLIYPRYPR
jgi:hypothetical protein